MSQRQKQKKNKIYLIFSSTKLVMERMRDYWYFTAIAINSLGMCDSLAYPNPEDYILSSSHFSRLLLISANDWTLESNV